MKSSSYSNILLAGLSDVVKGRSRELKDNRENLVGEASLARRFLRDVEKGVRSFSVKNLTLLAQAISLQPEAILEMAEPRLISKTDEAALASELDMISTLLCSSSRGLLLADLKAPDQGVVFVSTGFSALTGYGAEEIMGLNCRFLQRDDRAQPQIAVIRKAVADLSSCVVNLRNYRKDGSLFLNCVCVSPVFDQGEARFIFGFQKEIEN